MDDVFPQKAPSGRLQVAQGASRSAAKTRLGGPAAGRKREFEHPSPTGENIFGTEREPGKELRRVAKTHAQPQRQCNALFLPLLPLVERIFKRLHQDSCLPTVAASPVASSPACRQAGSGLQPHERAMPRAGGPWHRVTFHLLKFRSTRPEPS